MRQGLGSGDPTGRQWAGVWVMRRLCWATWFGGEPKQSYPGGKKSAERAEIEGNRAVERSAFRQKNGTACDWMWWDIGVILLPPLACSTESARTHGHSLGSPGPCFHCHHDILLGVFTVCVHQHFRSRPQPGRAPAMSSKEQKDTERSAKRPRVDQNLPSDALRNPDSVTPGNN